MKDITLIMEGTITGIITTANATVMIMATTMDTTRIIKEAMVTIKADMATDMVTEKEITRTTTKKATAAMPAGKKNTVEAAVAITAMATVAEAVTDVEDK